MFLFELETFPGWSFSPTKLFPENDAYIFDNLPILMSISTHFPGAAYNSLSGQITAFRIGKGFSDIETLPNFYGS